MDSTKLKAAYDHWSKVFEGEEYYTDEEERSAQIFLADEVKAFMEKLEPGQWQ